VKYNLCTVSIDHNLSRFIMRYIYCDKNCFYSKKICSEFYSHTQKYILATSICNYLKLECFTVTCILFTCADWQVVQVYACCCLYS